MNANHPSTRRTILNMLKTGEGLTVGDMSRQLGITEMAVRRHLSTLEHDGLITSVVERQAVGRPIHKYSLLEASEQFFPRNYHSLTLDLLSELENDSGTQAVEHLFQLRKQKLLGNYRTRMEGKSLEEKVSILAEIQNNGGYMAEWTQEEAGSFVLTEHNCPISQVALKFDHACGCELSLFETLLDAKVERTECLAKGQRRCVYRIEHAETESGKRQAVKQLAH